MTKVIAIAGKGGTGKTTICSLIIRYLIDNKKGTVLAVDADPDANLGEMLGIREDENIMGLIEQIANNPDMVPKGTSKNDFINQRMQSMVVESDGFDLIAMGRPEGPGCYCYANTALRDILGKIIKAYDFAVMDNEAGMEHLSRRTMRSADEIFIVSDYSVVGVRSAKRIFDLIKELKIKVKNISLLLNRLKNKEKIIEDEIKLTGINVCGYLGEDKELFEAITLGQSLIDSKKEFKAQQELNAILKERT